VAYAAQKNLEDVAEVIVWTQGIFELTKSYLESLLEALEDTEFGLFIFGPDDLIKIRGMEMVTARDNVVFELGLFIGRLGRDRSFILMPKDSADFHLPTDLLGITTARFQPPSRPDRLQAALGPACHDIRTTIRKHAVLHDAGGAEPARHRFSAISLDPRTRAEAPPQYRRWQDEGLQRRWYCPFRTATSPFDRTDSKAQWPEYWRAQIRWGV
jgi:hypothetical protein